MSNTDTPQLNYLMNAVLMYATAGLGIGLVIILLSEFGTYPFEMSGLAEMTAEELADVDEQFFSTVALFTILLVVTLAPILGGVSGLLAAGSFSNSDQAVLYAAIAAFLGSFIFVLLAVFLSSTALTEETVLITQIEGIELDGVVTNSLIVSIASTVPAAAGAYAATQ